MANIAHEYVSFIFTIAVADFSYLKLLIILKITCIQNHCSDNGLT